MTVSNKMFIFVNKINHNQYENKNQLNRKVLIYIGFQVTVILMRNF